MPGGETPGEVPWSDAPLMELVSKDAPGRKPCTAQGVMRRAQRWGLAHAQTGKASSKLRAGAVRCLPTMLRMQWHRGRVCSGEKIRICAASSKIRDSISDASASRPLFLQAEASDMLSLVSELAAQTVLERAE